MRYEPRIWKVGGVISLVSSLSVLLFAVGAIVYSIFKRKEKPA